MKWVGFCVLVGALGCGATASPGSQAASGAGGLSVVGSGGASGGGGASPAGGLAGTDALGGGQSGGALSAGNSGSEAGSAGVGGTAPKDYVVINGMARGSKQWLAVGANWSADPELRTGLIYSSENGRDWQLVASDLPVPLTDVAFGNDVFVAIGTPGFGNSSEPDAAFIYASSDGSSFEALALSGEDLARNFSFGNGVFLAVTRKRELLSSTNGLGWERLEIPPPVRTGGGLIGSQFAAGVFALFGEQGEVLISPTGMDWTSVEMMHPEFRSQRVFALHAVNDTFSGSLISECCFGEVPPLFALVDSLDGFNWNYSANAPIKVIETESVCVKLAADGVVRSGSDCSSVEPSYSGEVRATVALASDEIFLVAGDRGILFSSDGFTWEQVLAGPP